MNSRVAKKLRCQSVTTSASEVMVANGERLRCDKIFLAVPLEIQGYWFETSMYPLQLQGSDAVLGMQWLRSLGRVIHDWEKLTMEFTVAGEDYIIQGETTNSFGSMQSLQKMWANGVEAFLMQIVNNIESEGKTVVTTGHAAELDQLLAKYQSEFQVPTTLPLVRSHDHRITLELGAGPVNVRPYCYPHIQKNEIERAVKEMLSTEIIRPSFSPFSSPILLVKKKDGSWRFCVDYHALNQATIKDWYPIPMIDELLDELHGAAYFTKLDMKSGYHQI